jgi:phage terminase small subunit
MSERTLDNPKWERFAQELAKGKTADEAYQFAGYNENRGNAARLKANEIISCRVAELLERGAKSVELTVQMVAENLLRIADKAEALGEASGFNVAKGAWMDAAKIKGLVVEKKEVRAGSVLDDLPREALEELREMLLAERARRIYAAGDSRRSGEQANGCIH